MNISQRQLRMFVTTAAFRNISRASEKLHISQPALTRALKEFENQLGVVLFQRTTRQLSLTPQGEHFLGTAQRLLSDMERAASDLQALAGGQGGCVTLAVGSAFGCTVLPHALKAFAASHPGIQVRVIDDNSAGITARVSAGEVDFGIGSPVGDTGLLALEPLLSAPLGLLASPRHFALGATASVKDMLALPLLKEPAGTSTLQLLRAHGSELVERMNRGIEVSSLALQLSLAHAGLGVAVVSALGASHAGAAGLRFVRLRPRLERQVSVIRPRERPLSPAARQLADAVRTANSACSLNPLVRRARAG